MKKSIVIALLIISIASVCSAATWEAYDWVMLEETENIAAFYSPSSIRHQVTDDAKKTPLTFGQIKLYLKRENAILVFNTLIRDSDLYFVDGEVQVYKDSQDFGITKADGHVRKANPNSVRENLNKFIVKYGR